MRRRRPGPGRDDGAISILVAASVLLLAGVFTVALDAGALYLGKQRLQSTVDLAALKAVTDLTNAGAAVDAIVAADLESGSLVGSPQVETGRYPPAGYDMETVGTLPPESRFQAGAGDPNAIRVTLHSSVPTFLARVLYDGPMTVSASAVAFNKPLIQLTAATDVVAADSSKATAVDTVLSSLLATTVSLSAADYQRLIDADIRTLSFLDALAPTLGVSIGNYDGVLEAGITLPELVDAAIAAVQADPTMASASASLTATLNALRGQVLSVPPFHLEDIIVLDPDDPRDGTAARINLFALLRSSSETVNRENGLRHEVTVAITGGEAKVTVVALEPTQTSAVGGVATTVRTSQIRMFTEVLPAEQINLLGNLISLRLPIFTEMARGEAQATVIACNGPETAAATADVLGEAGDLSSHVADVDTTTLHQPTPPALDPANVVDVAGLVQVTAEGETSASGTPETHTFTGPFDGSNVYRYEISPPLESLGTLLLANTTYGVTILGLPLLTTDQVLAQVQPVLTAIAPAVDELLDNTFDVLGKDSGSLDVAVSYMRCSNPTIAG